MPLPANAIKLCLSGKINAIWVILATVLFPCAYITYMVQQGAGPVETDLAATKLLLDPGPRHRCYQYHDLGLHISYVNQAAGCQDLLGYGGCPMWRYSSFDAAGLDHDDLLVGGNGSLIDVLLVNNAEASREKTSQVSFDYYYPGCSIQQLTNKTQYNLLEFDQWSFEYDITIYPTSPGSKRRNGREPISNSSNSEGTRRYLTTEFIFQYPHPTCNSDNDGALNKSVATKVPRSPSSIKFTRFANSSLPRTTRPPLQSTISITHFDSQLANMTSPQKASPVNSNTTGLRSARNNTVLNLLSPTTIAPNSKTHITIDFKPIFQKYMRSVQMDNNTNATQPNSQLTPSLNAHMIRIVNGAQGLNSTVEVGNVSAVLIKGSAKKSNVTVGNYKVLDQQKSTDITSFCSGR